MKSSLQSPNDSQIPRPESGSSRGPSACQINVRLLVSNRRIYLSTSRTSFDVKPLVRCYRGTQPHFGQASTLVPFVSVMADAVFDPSALIKKISLFTRAEHGELRGVRVDEYAEKPIHVPSDDQIALLRDEPASPLFLFPVTRVTARVSRVSE